MVAQLVAQTCCNRTIYAAMQKIVHVYPPTHAALRRTGTRDPQGGKPRIIVYRIPFRIFVTKYSQGTFSH